MFNTLKQILNNFDVSDMNHIRNISASEKDSLRQKKFSIGKTSNILKLPITVRYFEYLLTFHSYFLANKRLLIRIVYNSNTKIKIIET